MVQLEPRPQTPDTARGPSATAGRILAAAQALAFKRGFRGVTIAEIAEKASVGKGTLYLYWSTKEELFLSLLLRSFHSVVDELIDQLQGAPDLVRPTRLVPWLLGATARGPLILALQTRDIDVLGALARDVRTSQQLRKYGATALADALWPVWRRHGLVRGDVDAARQAYGLHMLTVGFVETSARTGVMQGPEHEWAKAVLVESLATLLGERPMSARAMLVAAQEGLSALNEFRASFPPAMTIPEPSQ